MRSLVLLCSLLSFAIVVAADGAADGIANGAADLTLEQRKKALIDSAEQAGAAMGRAEYYIEYLPPMADHIVSMPDLARYVLFEEGWSRPEKWGIWSLGNRSVLFLRRAQGPTPRELTISGRYLNGEEATRLLVNNVLVSEAPLLDAKVPLPVAVGNGEVIKIELQHLNPVSPHDLDATVGDRRKMKFGLISLGLQ
jgi:hypothetical protein